MVGRDSSRASGGRYFQSARGRGEGKGRRGRYSGRGRAFNKVKNNPKNYTMTRFDVTIDNTIQNSNAFQFCCKEECEERQMLHQIHELEATKETCTLPQVKRILDPCLAVSKFKRSAAGTKQSEIKSVAALEHTLIHLQRVCATRKASAYHSVVGNFEAVAEFLVDRLRSCQSDATRLSAQVPSRWHVQLVRILLWIRYWTVSNSKSWMGKVIHKMISTAFDAYWSARQVNEICDFTLDDEMLCWSALIQITSPTPTCSYNSILLEYSKYMRSGISPSAYPLWHNALRIICHLARQEYCFAWKKAIDSILFRICLEPVLFKWRYTTGQHYNQSFAKHEAVTNIPQLLNIHGDDWSIDYAQRFGLPTEQSDGNIAIIFKKEPMKNIPLNITEIERVQDHHWVFGKLYDGQEACGIEPQLIEMLLQEGAVD
jgi:hypothetical protein